ncbi:MAG: 4a-hydroxytetrahydrobiopterin dehydratase [SAR86 cluster bacterium]|uniref:Putative pterin-4-alpha-carbinolamine dehydratase n=1 Tax=SAR86 cluster bacterium TaxID=2030880 RepID=A0A2A5BAQ6_9GAMM|nr:MAG: 4a-hydroxytetrahydrobiopterin dehydratase [SAR86 cluster bacterium]
MENLYQKHCEACIMGAPLVTDEESSELMLKVPAWKRDFHDGVEKLIREFHFIEFKDAFAFTYKIANLAERENHHPSMMTEWGKVTVYWWTHKINGLHVNDFIMASKTDMIAKLSAKS